MLNKFLTIFFTFFLVVFAFIGCRKEVTTDNSDKKFPLHLQMSLQNGIPTFSWDKANHSEFERYVLLSSENMIPFGINPLAASGSISQRVSFSKRDSTTFTDLNTSFVPTVFYKLYLVLGSRVLESENVQFNQLIQSLDFSQSTLVFDTEDSLMVAVDQGSSFISVYNYVTNTVVNSTNVPNQFFQQVLLAIGREGNNKVLYVLENSSSIRRFSLPNLQQLSSVSHSESVFGAFVANNNNTLFYTTFDFSQSLILRRQSTLQKFMWHQRNNYFEKRGLCLVDPSTNLMLEYSSTLFSKFSVNNSTGAISTLLEKNNNDFDNVDVFNVAPLSPDKLFFIPKLTGDVYNMNFEKVLNVNFQQLTHAAFNTTGDAIYYAAFDFSSGTQKTSLHKVAFPSGVILKTVDLGINNATIGAVVPLADDKLFIVIRDFNLNRMLCKTINF